jgi:COP9 signalosome complex subunit 7
MEVVIQANEEKSGGGKRGNFGSDDAMDIDDEGGSGRNTRGSRKMPGGFGLFGGTNMGMGRRLG